MKKTGTPFREINELNMPEFALSFSERELESIKDAAHRILLDEAGFSLPRAYLKATVQFLASQGRINDGLVQGQAEEASAAYLAAKPSYYGNESKQAFEAGYLKAISDFNKAKKGDNHE